MKFSKLTVAFATLSLAVASAASNNTYRVTLNDAAWVGSTELKPGDYKIEIEGDKAVIKSGKKNVVEVPVKVEKADRKSDTTQVLVRSANNKQEMKEIRIGGTTTRIVLENPSRATE